MYREKKPEEFELVLAATKENSVLPSYFQIYTLSKIGFWTKPDVYSHYPLLILKKKSKNNGRFKIPEMMMGNNDPLIAKNMD